MDEETGYVELVHDVEKNTCCPYDLSYVLLYVILVLSGTLFIVLLALLLHKFFT
jgi:hypothetical protein